MGMADLSIVSYVFLSFKHKFYTMLLRAPSPTRQDHLPPFFLKIHITSVLAGPQISNLVAQAREMKQPKEAHSVPQITLLAGETLHLQ